MFPAVYTIALISMNKINVVKATMGETSGGLFIYFSTHSVKWEVKFNDGIVEGPPVACHLT